MFLRFCTGRIEISGNRSPQPFWWRGLCNSVEAVWALVAVTSTVTTHRKLPQVWQAALRWPEVQDAQCRRVGSRGLWLWILWLQKNWGDFSPPVRWGLLDFMLVSSFLLLLLPSSFVALLVFFNREPHVSSVPCRTSTSRANARKNAGRYVRKTVRMNIRRYVRKNARKNFSKYVRMNVTRGKIPENKYGGFHCFEMPWWGLFEVDLEQFFLHFFSWLKLQDVTVDEFIDVIDGNRKYCKCGSACRDVISCFLISFHVTTCGKFARLKGIYVYNKHLGILVGAWHCWKLCRKDLFFISLYLLLCSPFVLWFAVPCCPQVCFVPLFFNIKLPIPPEGAKKSARFFFARVYFFCSNALPPKKSARFPFPSWQKFIQSNPGGPIIFCSVLNIFVLF